MAELDFPTINNNPVSWARITLQIGGASLSGSQALRGFRALSYKTTIERSPVKGAGRRIIGYTDGNIADEASVTFIYETYDHLVQLLGEGFMDKPLTLSISFRLGTGVVRKVEIQASGMKESGGDFSEGTEGLEVPIPLDVVRILYDGKDPALEPVDLTSV